MSDRLDTSKISPSALYTSYIWYRHQLSPKEVKTRKGSWYYQWMRPIEFWAKFRGKPTLEEMLVARHLSIDTLTKKIIDEPGEWQIVELAAGLSTRGMRVRQEREITFFEGDLYEIVSRKAKIFKKYFNSQLEHELVVFDLLSTRSFKDLSLKLDSEKKTIVIAEGILSYFETAAVAKILTNCRKLIGKTQGGFFLCDAHFKDEVAGVRGSKIFNFLQSTFVKSRMKLPWQTESEARQAFQNAGFRSHTIYQSSDILPEDSHKKGLVRIALASL